MRSYGVDGRLVRIAAGPLGVWALTAPGSGPLTGPEGERRLVRIDRGSRKPLLKLSCDGTLTVGVRWLWLSDVCAKTVTRLDLRTGAITTLDVGGEPWSIALGAGAAWVSTGLGLKRIAVGSADVTLVSPRNNSLAVYSDGPRVVPRLLGLPARLAANHQHLRRPRDRAADPGLAVDRSSPIQHSETARAQPPLSAARLRSLSPQSSP